MRAKPGTSGRRRYAEWSDMNLWGLVFIAIGLFSAAAGLFDWD